MWRICFFLLRVCLVPLDRFDSTFHTSLSKKRLIQLAQNDSAGQCSKMVCDGILGREKLIETFLIEESETITRQREVPAEKK